MRLLAVVVLAAAGCSIMQTGPHTDPPPVIVAPPQTLVQEMDKLTAIEARARSIRNVVALLGSQGLISQAGWLKLRSHYDVHWTYYHAAAVALANGDLERFWAHVKAANAELDAMKKLLENKEGPPAQKGESQSL